MVWFKLFLRYIAFCIITSLTLNVLIGLNTPFSWLVGVLFIGLIGVFTLSDQVKLSTLSAPALPISGKSKHPQADKYDLLFRLMDEEERADFKAFLKQQAIHRLSDDGELPLDANLFEDEPNLKSNTR